MAEVSLLKTRSDVCCWILLMISHIYFYQCFDSTRQQAINGANLDPDMVGQSREIRFEFGSIFATALAVSEACSTTELASSGVASFIQNTKLFTWRTWPGASAVPRCDQQSVTRGTNSGESIKQSTFYMATHN